MDEHDQIRKFEEFIDTHYRAKLFENLRRGQHFLTFDFTDISKFDPKLADDLIEMPEETLKSAEHAIRHFDISDKVKNIFIRVKNLPKSQTIKICNLRATDIGKLITVDGVVRQKSDVRPQVTSARFECPACGNIISVNG